MAVQRSKKAVAKKAAARKPAAKKPAAAKPAPKKAAPKKALPKQPAAKKAGTIVAAPAAAAGAAVAPADWPLWEVFVRSKQGLDHRHCGSLHAVDARQALNMARDVYTRRQEGVSIWVVPSNLIVASEPEAKEELFDPMADKIYRHPTFYQLPDAVKHM